MSVFWSCGLFAEIRGDLLCHLFFFLLWEIKVETWEVGNLDRKAEGLGIYVMDGL